MRLRHALPAGLVDAGCNSLTTLVMGVFAARALETDALGTYALFFSAYVLALVAPMQLVLVPAEFSTMSVAAPDRLGLLRQTRRLGLPVATGTAALATLAACVAAVAPAGLLLPLALTTAAAAVAAPLQDHLRRVLHLAELSWHAALVSVVQLGSMLALLAIAAVAGVPVAWLPFGVLAVANLVSGAAGVLAVRDAVRRAAVPRYGFRELLHSGRWLMLVEVATAGGAFLSAALVTRLAGAVALGHAEAARIVAQPLMVMAQGLNAVLGPRLVRAGATRDRAMAARFTKPFVALISMAGLLYGLVTVGNWPGNPIGALIPQAYEVPWLVAASVLAMTLFVLPFPQRGELVGAHAEARIFRIAMVAALAQSAVALSAITIGAFARPLSLALFGAVLLAGYQVEQRRLYGAWLREAEGATRRRDP